MKFLHHWSAIVTLVTLAIIYPYTTTGAPLNEAQSSQYTIRSVESDWQVQRLARAEGSELEPVRKEEPRWENVMSTGGTAKKCNARYRGNAEDQMVGTFHVIVKRSERSRRGEDQPPTPPDANNEAQSEKTGDKVEQDEIGGLTYEQLRLVLSPKELKRYAAKYKVAKAWPRLRYHKSIAKQKGRLVNLPDVIENIIDEETLSEIINDNFTEFERMRREVERKLIESGKAPAWLIERKAKRRERIQKYLENLPPEKQEEIRVNTLKSQRKTRLTVKARREVLKAKQKSPEGLTPKEEGELAELERKRKDKSKKDAARGRTKREDSKGKVDNTKPSINAPPPPPPRNSNNNDDNNRLQLSMAQQRGTIDSTTIRTHLPIIDNVNRLPNRFISKLSDMGRNFRDTFARVAGRSNAKHPPGITTPAPGIIRPAAPNPGLAPVQLPPLAVF